MPLEFCGEAICTILGTPADKLTTSEKLSGGTMDVTLKRF